MKASKIATKIEQLAPLNLAEDWDNVGFQIGSKTKDINKILTVLDINEDTIEEAIKNNVDMIVSHHPFFFRGIKRIDLDSIKGQMIEDLIKNDVVVYSAHTNLDKAENGINQFIAELLDLKNIKPLKIDKVNSNFYKLIIYVPIDSTDKILDVLYKLEVGSLYDNYINCTFRTEGTGTFEPINEADPYLGELNKLEEAKEAKIETVISESEINNVLNKIKKVHPYEEMAYDLFRVEIKNYPVKEGLGRIGKTRREYSPEEFINFVKEKLEVEYLREAGPRPQKIKKVALCTGAGSEFIQLAKNKGADVYISGDLKYHEAQSAKEAKLWVLDAGHFGTEKQTIRLLKEFLDKNFPDLEIISSNVSKDFINLV